MTITSGWRLRHWNSVHQNWVLLIEFENERVSALRVRTDDGSKYHPAEAPRDKERLRAGAAQPHRSETVPELCPPGTDGAQFQPTPQTPAAIGCSTHPTEMQWVLALSRESSIARKESGMALQNLHPRFKS